MGTSRPFVPNYPFFLSSLTTSLQENVVISSAGVPLIMDFGVSHMIISTTTVETATDAQRGSLRWQARELLVNETHTDDTPHHTKQSDIWAFGMTCLVKSSFMCVCVHALIVHFIGGALTENTLCKPQRFSCWIAAL